MKNRCRQDGSRVEVVAHELRAVVTREHEAQSDALAEAAELFAHRLADRLQRLEPQVAPGDVDAQATDSAVLILHCRSVPKRIVGRGHPTHLACLRAPAAPDKAPQALIRIVHP